MKAVLAIISALVCALVVGVASASASTHMCTYRYSSVLIAFYGPRATYSACSTLQSALGRNWQQVSNRIRANNPTCAWATPNYQNYIAVASTYRTYLTRAMCNVLANEIKGLGFIRII